MSFAERKLDLSGLASYRAEHFPYSGPYPWLDRPNAMEEIDRKESAGELSGGEAAQCRKWSTDGYIIIRGLIDAGTLDRVWTSYERAVRAGKIQLPADPAGDADPFPGRFLNPHKRAGAFCEILKHPGLLSAIRMLMEREPRVLQTIASHKGSQQPEHSDSIHMTTYPLGYLTAAWIAFEDIHPDSGPLVYYPGSHRLPYVFSKDVDISESDYKREGYAAYQAKYEPFIRQLLERNKLEPQYFHARKGDVLLWHANLIHGGSERRDLRHSRRAVVVHFFVKGAFVYHDLAASRSRQQYMGTCLLRDEAGRNLIVDARRFFGRSRNG
ncbi:MAG TPA: phytanoyl-CoA dioxygenase family protein [Bryobacteraceae bacterium]|nr:phytanoyl-CoA dioxygenase family protein [Bryobacteraceae bacterium]